MKNEELMEENPVDFQLFHGWLAGYMVKWLYG
jgi:hypothetical protein